MSNSVANVKNRNGNAIPSKSQSAASQAYYYTPRFDLWEGDQELVLYGDLPGVSAETLELHIENGELMVHGHAPLRGEGAEFLSREYGVADFHRSFTVGDEIDIDNISAEMKHGVLTVHLPKAEKIKARRIEVRAA